VEPVAEVTCLVDHFDVVPAVAVEDAAQCLPRSPRCSR
jgi:hypothetical protein